VLTTSKKIERVLVLRNRPASTTYDRPGINTIGLVKRKNSQRSTTLRSVHSDDSSNSPKRQRRGGERSSIMWGGQSRRNWTGSTSGDRSRIETNLDPMKVGGDVVAHCSNSKSPTKTSGEKACIFRAHLVPPTKQQDHVKPPGKTKVLDCRDQGRGHCVRGNGRVRLLSPGRSKSRDFKAKGSQKAVSNVTGCTTDGGASTT